MVDPPRLHKQLGANWVEVTMTVLGEAKTILIINVSDIENVASNTR